MKKTNNNLNRQSSLSQKEKIRRHLLKGKAITPLEALIKWHCLRLGARIYELQQKPDYLKIEHRMKLLRSGKHVMEYRLAVE